MTYDEVVKKLQTMLEIPLNQEDENFRRILPRIIEYAENRIYRELDFLITTIRTSAIPLVANNREMALPAHIIVLRQLNVTATLPKLMPGGFTQLFTTRHVLDRVSPEMLDMYWPHETFEKGLPQKYALVGTVAPVFDDVGGPPPQKLSYVIRFAPTPDKAYTAEFLGVIRPTTLSPTNTETYLSTMYPDLFCAACMVFASGYQRDFGAQADDPQKAMSWEGMYNNLRQGVVMEATKQKEGAVMAPAPAAPPQARAG